MDPPLTPPTTVSPSPAPTPVAGESEVIVRAAGQRVPAQVVEVAEIPVASAPPAATSTAGVRAALSLLGSTVWVDSLLALQPGDAFPVVVRTPHGALQLERPGIPGGTLFVVADSHAPAAEGTRAAPSHSHPEYTSLPHPELDAARQALATALRRHGQPNTPLDVEALVSRLGNEALGRPEATARLTADAVPVAPSLVRGAGVVAAGLNALDPEPAAQALLRALSTSALPDAARAEIAALLRAGAGIGADAASTPDLRALQNAIDRWVGATLESDAVLQRIRGALASLESGSAGAAASGSGDPGLAASNPTLTLRHIQQLLDDVTPAADRWTDLSPGARASAIELLRGLEQERIEKHPELLAVREGLRDLQQRIDGAHYLQWLEVLARERDEAIPIVGAWGSAPERLPFRLTVRRNIEEGEAPTGFTLEIDSHTLGELTVQGKVAESGSAESVPRRLDLQMTAESPASARRIEIALPRLHEALDAQGYQATTRVRRRSSRDAAATRGSTHALDVSG